MKLIEQYVQILDGVGADRYVEAIMKVERAGRVCYKSECMQTVGSAEPFIRTLIRRGHASVLEHVNLTLKWVTDRGVTHELVRHRLASYSQESTRYCNYGKDDIEFINPVDYMFDELDILTLKGIEATYKSALFKGRTPQQARAILPNCLKTEIVLTMNIREWRHVLKLRTAPAAHPQMRDMAVKTLGLLQIHFPVFFEDLV